MHEIMPEILSTLDQSREYSLFHTRSGWFCSPMRRTEGDPMRIREIGPGAVQLGAEPVEPVEAGEGVDSDQAYAIDQHGELPARIARESITWRAERAHSALLDGRSVVEV